MLNFQRKLTIWSKHLKVTTQAKITGIFGYPIGHTLSPYMHNAAYSALGLNYTYLPFEVAPTALRDAIKSIKELNICAINITVPHKEMAMKFVDKIDQTAKKIGSINTIVNKNGTLYGYNTDAPGFIEDLKVNGFTPKDKTALLLGAGGVGKAIAAALELNGIKRIYLFEIDANKASSLVKKVKSCKTITQNDFKKIKKELNLCVNATPIGMHKGDPSVLPKDMFTKNCFYYDVIYNRETEFIKLAKAAKAAASGGLGMLLMQGVKGFELWTGKKAPVEVMRKALIGAMKK